MPEQNEKITVAINMIETETREDFIEEIYNYLKPLEKKVMCNEESKNDTIQWRFAMNLLIHLKSIIKLKKNAHPPRTTS